MMGEIRARHRPPWQSHVFANYALRRDLPEALPAHNRPVDGLPRLVYQGTLLANGGHYDLRALFDAIAGQGVALDIYPGRPGLCARAVVSSRAEGSLDQPVGRGQGR